MQTAFVYDCTSQQVSFHAPALAPSKTGVATCAANFADEYSNAGGLNALGIGKSSVGGFITSAIGGNASVGSRTKYPASVAVLLEAIASSTTWASLMAGPLQGIPGGRGPWGASVSDLATGAIAGGAFSAVTGTGQTLQGLNGAASLASTGIDAAEVASGVGLVKFGYNALSYGAGLLGCKTGAIQ